MNEQVNYAKIQRIQDNLEALTIGTFGTGFVTDAMMYESGIKATVADHTSQLAEKAKQIDLNTTNNNVNATNLRVDALVINSGDANTEVTDSHVSTAKNKSFSTVRNRFEEIESETFIPVRNLLTNSGFENGLTSWNKNGTATATIETSIVKSGTKSFRVLSSADYYQNVLNTVGHKIYVSAYAYVVTPSANVSKLYLRNVSSVTNAVSVNVDQTKVGVWQRISGIKEVTDSGVRVTLLNGTDTDIIFDNIVAIDINDLMNVLGITTELTLLEIDNILQNYTGTYFETYFNLLKTKYDLLNNYWKGKANGIAPLNVDGIISPEYVSFSPIIKDTVNLYNKDGELLDGYLYGGTINGIGSYYHQFIKVKEGNTYNMLSAINIDFVDKDYETVTSFSTAQTTNGVFIVPSGLNIEYVSLTVPIANVDTQYLVDGSTKPTITPVYGYKMQESILLSEKQKIEVADIVNTTSLYQGKSIMVLGDSISAIPTDVRGWQKYFNEIVNPTTFVNTAVAGATWTDYPQTTAYDGINFDSYQNVIGNQVQKIINNSYSDPDIIIIAAGTNDSVSTQTDTSIETQFYIDGSNVPFANVDRTTWAGAFRYTIEKLRELYPNAQIFITTPLQRANTTVNQQDAIRLKNDLIKRLALRMSVPVIDAVECGIYGENAISGSATLDYNDGLHLSAIGAEKMGKYIARKIINWFCF